MIPRPPRWAAQQCRRGSSVSDVRRRRGGLWGSPPTCCATRRRSSSFLQPLQPAPSLLSSVSSTSARRDYTTTPPCSRQQQQQQPQPLAQQQSSSLQRNNSSSSSSSSSYSNHNFPNNKKSEFDRLLVVGSGVAGSAAALVAAETYRIPVTLLFAGQLPTDCNSWWAQGGIIYKGRSNDSDGDSNEDWVADSPELLAADIHRAGAGLCHDPAVRKVASEGPERVRQLLLNTQSRFANVPFDVDPATGELALCLEASHSAARILHKADHTGQVITQHITAAAARHPLITLQPSTIVTDVKVADGLAVGLETLQPVDSNSNSNNNNSNAVVRPVTEYATRGIVLAAGGLAGIYEHSTNPVGFNALGSSVALAARCDAMMATRDLEFVQFHPTALRLPGQSPFLLTEALRGEGAVLRDGAGRAFAREYHPHGELAPRDVVARAVFAESQKKTTTSNKQQQHNAFLDITHRDAAWLHRRFPTIAAHLRENSHLDLARDWLPIVPAAHYTCGGVATDLDGQTTLPGCYAAGEAARTGLHGGNRLASTSLLEGLVFGAAVADHAALSDEARARTGEAARAVAALQRQDEAAARTPISSSSSSTNNSNSTAAAASQLLRQLRRVMWDHVGVTRTVSGLRDRALPRLAELRAAAEALHSSSGSGGAPSRETAAVRDATCAGHAVAQAALANRTSVGAHCLVADGDRDGGDDDSSRKEESAAAAAAAAAASDSDSDDEAEVAVAR